MPLPASSVEATVAGPAAWVGAVGPDPTAIALQFDGLGVDPLLLRLVVAVVALAALITVGRILLNLAWRLVVIAGAVVAVLFVASLLL